MLKCAPLAAAKTRTDTKLDAKPHAITATNALQDAHIKERAGNNVVVGGWLVHVGWLDHTHDGCLT